MEIIELIDSECQNIAEMLKAKNTELIDPKILKRRETQLAYRIANKEKTKIRNSAYYKNNKEKIKQINNLWRKANAERVKIKSAEWYKANAQKIAERNKVNADKKAEYYRNNIVRITKIHAEYAKKNIEKIKARSAEYRKENAEKIKIKHAAYHKANIEKRVAYNKANAEKISGYYKINPERFKAKTAKRRAMKRTAGGSFTSEDIKKMLRQQKRKCIVCKIDISKSYHIDHVMPLAKGGHNGISNIQLLCPKCNLQKSSKHPIDFMQENGYLL